MFLRSRSRLFLILSVLIFLSASLVSLQRNMTVLLSPTLRDWDESVNLTVSGNLYRKIWPPLVRINSLSKDFENWQNGPQWQHIPPVFSYVPLPLFWLDGKVSVEIARLSYGILAVLTGVLFLVLVYLFDGSLLAVLAALLASCFWITHSFTQGLITGYHFGYSDLVLACSLVVAMGACVGFMKASRDERLKLGWVLFWAFLCGLPLIVKSVLGGIPVLSYFLLLVGSKKLSRRKQALGAFFLLLPAALVYSALYLSSPSVFMREIFVPFEHFKDYESWGRPFYYGFVYFWKFYLLENLLYAFVFLVFFGLALRNLVKSHRYLGHLNDTSPLLFLSIVWFLFNFIAISLVTSKVPACMYQSFIFVIYVCVYSVLEALRKKAHRIDLAFPRRYAYWGIAIFSLFNALMIRDCISSFTALRKHPYVDGNIRTHMYRLAEYAQKNSWGMADLVVISPMEQHYWYRYPFIFLTGSETRTTQEISRFKEENDFEERVRSKYKQIRFVCLPVLCPDLVLLGTSLLKSELVAGIQVFSFDVAKIEVGVLSKIKFE